MQAKTWVMAATVYACRSTLHRCMLESGNQAAALGNSTGGVKDGVCQGSDVTGNMYTALEDRGLRCFHGGICHSTYANYLKAQKR
jgi:hypothetical protein